jgi:Protein of unknown function (DUF3987)
MDVSTSPAANPTLSLPHPPSSQESSPSSDVSETKSAVLCFPESAMVGIGREFVDLYGQHLESPAEFLYASWHTCFGLAISPLVRLDLQVSSRPRLYTVLLGDSALPRKSTSIGVSVRFWDRLVMPPFPACFRTEYGLGSVEGFARVFNGWNKKDEPDTRPALIVYDELQSFVEKAKQKGSLLLPMASSLFESKEYDGTTSKRIVSLRGCRVALLGASTLDTYEHMWTPEFTNIGLPNRFFILKGNRTKSVAIPKSPPESLQRELEGRVRKLLQRISEWSKTNDGKIRFSPDAERLWIDYYPSIEKGGIHSKRLDTYAFRWMILLALSQEEFEVSSHVVEQAIQLIEYELSVRRLYDPIDAEDNVAKMEEKIRRIMGERPSVNWPYRVLQQRSHSNRVGNWVLMTALSNLERAGEVRRETTKNAWIRLP